MTTMQPDRFGWFTRPSTPGMFRLGTIGTRVLFAGLIIALTANTFGGQLPAGVVVVLTGLALWGVKSRDQHDMTTLAKLIERYGWWVRILRKEPTMRQSIFNPRSWGTNTLPGVAARMKAFEEHDGHGNPFVVLQLGAHYVVVFTATPIGGGDVDQAQINQWVANFGESLKLMADLPDLVQAQIVIETAPDTEGRMQKNVRRRIRPGDAPPFAVQVMDEALGMAGDGAPHARMFAAFTFNASIGKSGALRPRREVIEEVNLRLPAVTAQLATAGLGVVRALSRQHLAEMVRVAYDPVVAGYIDDARAAGDTPDIAWAEAGPTAHELGWDVMRHDSGYSLTAVQTVPPRTGITANRIKPLLAPSPDLARKRVAFLYQPIDLAVAEAIADTDLNAKENHAKANPKSAAATRDLQAARATSADQAAGAALVNFAIVVTVTVTDEARVPAARTMLADLASRTRVKLRPAYGMQDGAFLLTLPLGLVPGRHVRLSSAVRMEL